MIQVGKGNLNKSGGLKANYNGRALESKIQDILDLLEAEKIALVQKTPEPTRPISKITAQGTFTSVFTKKAQPDFKGTLKGGRCVIFEAKFCQNNSIRIDRVIPEQLNMLRKYQEFGAAAFIWVGFSQGGFDSGRFYAIPLNDWTQLSEKTGRKSANKTDLIDYDVTNFIRLKNFFKSLIK